MHAVRKIVKIDEEKCNGCGLCVPACAEGAIKIIDGKARLVSEVFCDGLGACIGECPQGALTIEERDAEAFDEVVVHAAGSAPSENASKKVNSAAGSALGMSCPGAACRDLITDRVRTAPRAGNGAARLRNWPVQLRLVPVNAPYFNGAKLLISADCAAFACPEFHSNLLDDAVLLVGCPKLDDVSLYRKKLAEIFKQNDVRAVEIVHMEVPCCYGLVHLVGLALQDSGREIPVTVTEVGVRGEVRGTRVLEN